MGKGKRQNQSCTPDTSANGPTSEGPHSELGGISDHIGKLRQVTSTTETLMDLLVRQLQGLSVTIPVLRGFEILEQLRERMKECHEGSRTGFGLLRDHIEREKGLFYTKNAVVIEQIIRERVSEGVKRRLPVVLGEQLNRYYKYLETNNVLTDEVKRVTATASARTANSLLSIKYPTDEVTLIPPHPDWGGITLGNLKNIGGPEVAKLASDQGLTPTEASPDSDMTRVKNLNTILSHLGVPYQAIPSWNGVLLTSVSRKADP